MQRAIFDTTYYVFCLAGLAFASYLLYQATVANISKVYTADSGASVARLVSNRNDVKVRASTHPIWVNAKDELVVYERDTVFTGDDSSTVVSFDKGASLEISQNSLVVIDKREDQGKAEVIKGFLLVKLGGSKTKIEIKIGGVKTIIQSKTAEIQIDARKRGASAITVIKGSAKVTSAKKTLELKENQRTTVSKKKELEAIETIPIALKSPTWRQKFFQRPSLTIPFKWTSDGVIEKFKFEIAKDKEFKRRIYNKLVNKHQVHLSKIAPGSYYWRVTPVSSASNTNTPSITYRFSIAEIASPSLTRPFRNENFLITLRDSEEATRNVPVNWKKITSAEKYRIQVSKDFQFKQIVFTHNVATPPYVIKNLKPGKYQIRVQSIESNTPSKWSLPTAFQVNLDNIPKPSNILSPPDRSIFSISRDNAPISIRWGKSKDVKEYIVELTAGKEFRSQIVSKRTPQTEFIWTPKRTGQFSWHVRPIDPAGRKTRFSPTKSFVINTAAPTLILPKDNRIKLVKSLKRAAVQFSWSKSWSAKQYILEVSTDSSFKIPLLKRKMKRTVFAWKPPRKGLYYWRVSVDNSNIVSSTSRFEIKKRKLSAPKFKGTHRFEIETY